MDTRQEMDGGIIVRGSTGGVGTRRRVEYAAPLDPKLFLSRVLMRTDPSFPICRGDRLQSRHLGLRREQKQQALGILVLKLRSGYRLRVVIGGQSMPGDVREWHLWMMIMMTKLPKERIV